ncbi:MAG: glycosyltransferase family 4 protein [Candidatus Fermentibacter daniensis]
MKIVISNSMMIWGGGENWSLTAARGLQSRGHDVVLVCRPGSSLHERAVAEGGVRVETVSIRGDLNPSAVIRAASLFERHGTAIACCNLDREVRSLGLAAKMKGVVFIRRRGSDYGFKNSLRYILTYRHLVDGVMVNSDSTMNSILAKNRWLDRSRLRKIYNGIDAGLFQPDADAGAAFRRSVGLAAEDLVIGISGSLQPRKRHSVLFEACSGLEETFPRMRILVAGPAPSSGHEARVADQAAAAGVGEITTFAGPVSDMVGCYNAMDFLCMPSSNEGFGYAAAEAMSCAKPVIVSDASSLPEVAGPAGMIFPVDDAAALRAMITRLAGDPALRSEMGGKSRKRVLSLFTIDRMLDDLEEYFDEMTGRRAGGA